MTALPLFFNYRVVETKIRAANLVTFSTFIHGIETELCWAFVVVCLGFFSDCLVLFFLATTLSMKFYG